MNTVERPIDDRPAFYQFFVAHQTDVYNYVYRLMRADEEDAFDLTQDTFLSARQRFPTLEHDPRAAVWLYQTATRHCLAQLRHRGSLRWTWADRLWAIIDPTHLGRDTVTAAPANRTSDTTEEVQIILDGIQTNHRIVLLLREYHDQNYEAIGQIMGIGRPAVRELLYQGREAFRQVYCRVLGQTGQTPGV